MLPPQEKVVNGTSQVAAHGEAPLVQEAASAAERAAGWKTPPSRMQEILWSGSKRHVFLGMLGISAIAAIPWLLLTSGILDSLYHCLERECGRFVFRLGFVLRGFMFISSYLNLKTSL